VSVWRATKAKRVFAALLRNGWTVKKQVGSHRKLQFGGRPNFTFCFHDSEEIGRAALAKIGKATDLGLRTSEQVGWQTPGTVFQNSPISRCRLLN